MAKIGSPAVVKSVSRIEMLCSVQRVVVKTVVQFSVTSNEAERHQIGTEILAAPKIQTLSRGLRDEYK